jgi:hypothetical protein
MAPKLFSFSFQTYNMQRYNLFPLRREPICNGWGVSVGVGTRSTVYSLLLPKY